MIRRTTALAFAVALAAAAPAHAQRASLADRVAVLEARAATPAVSVDLLNQISQLQNELRALRSQVEELQQQNEQLRNSARVQYLDLDGRLMRLEGGAAPAPAAAPAVPALTGVPAAGASAPASASGTGATAPRAAVGTAATAPVAGEQASYDAAFAHLKAGDYVAAARAFDAFLRDFPSGTYAPNARYWLGESYYVTQNYRLALPQFQTLVQQHPTHDKAPGALLKVGLTQQGLKEFDAAERTLREVPKRYPNTDAARTAADRLRALELTRLR
ncbi:tol-pal system protein YbgF [Cognatilysobacter bugurensis]|uniref:Cell division coordinator CpoB n=1 Tax=Cognatilysobacter bugurensis TaxID=543356 RepID=A0A918SZV9_9GAMM|nr:tol-pal system protein YbgF [Lysobacter bugurensis]GHA80805.1 tol-pal system protein YbgF [Lysobacter bugurensis]